MPWRARVHSLMTGLLVPSSAGTEEQEQCFQSRAAELTAAGFRRTCLFIVALNTVTAAFDWLPYPRGSAIRQAVLLFHLAIPVLCLPAVFLLRPRSRWVRHSFWVAVATTAVSLTSVGLLASQSVGLDTPFFACSNIVQLATVLLVTDLRRRILASLLINVPFLIGFFAARPEQMGHVFLLHSLDWLAASQAAAIAAGHGIYQLVRSSFFKQRELDARAQELALLRQAEIDLKEAAILRAERLQLEMLRYQLNPHFLFNTLNSVDALIARQPEQARSLILALAAFCRETLDGRERETNPLREELSMVGRYLEIQKVRWEEHLEVTVEAARESLDWPVPAFILQPLVENAVRFGQLSLAHQAAEQVKVRVSSRIAGELLLIEVANSGRWFEPGELPPRRSTGIGLENVRQRLQRLYRGAQRFEVESEEGWVVARLGLPRQEQDEPALTATARGP